MVVTYGRAGRYCLMAHRRCVSKSQTEIDVDVGALLSRECKLLALSRFVRTTFDYADTWLFLPRLHSRC